MTRKKAVKKADDKVVLSSLDALRSLSTQMVARDEIDYVLKLAVLTKQHVQVEGPPGTGKTLQAKLFFRNFEGEYFDTTLSKESLEDVLYGMMDIAAMREGKYGYCYEGSLLTAHWAYLDEGFDASDRLLRSLNTPLNEREFKRGTFHMAIPLRTCIMTSNYSRQNEVLDALVDRFLFKIPVLKVTGSDKEKVLKWEEPLPPEDVIKLADLDEMHTTLKAIPFDNKTLRILIELSDEFGFTARRTRQAKDVIQAHCLLQGEKKVETHDVVVLKYLISSEPGKYRDAYSRITELTINTAKICAQEEVLKNLQKEMMAASENADIKTRLIQMAAVVRKVKKIRPLNDEMSAKKSKLIDQFTNSYRYQFTEGIRSLGWEVPEGIEDD